jgi:hypothetical protein
VPDWTLKKIEEITFEIFLSQNIHRNLAQRSHRDLRVGLEKMSAAIQQGAVQKAKFRHFAKPKVGEIARKELGF